MKTISKNLAKLEKILDLAKKGNAAEAEIIYRSRSDNPVSFENNKLKTLESNQSSGTAIRLIKNNKIGIASSTDPDAVESIVNSALEASEYGPQATFELSKEKLEAVNHTSTPGIPLEKLLERGIKVIDALKAFHKDLLISGGYDLSFSETLYLNTNGISGKRSKNIYSSGFYTNLVRGEDFLGIYEGNSSLEDFPDDKCIINTLLEKLNYSKENLSLETKKYLVLFTPRAVSSIFEYIFSVILNGKYIEQKISPLTDKLGKEIFDKKLTFIEDPNTGTGKTVFDDEGTKTVKKELIKNGVVKSFYFDLSSASRVMPRHDSTGNGFKPSLSSPPSPSLTSLVIEGGKTKYKDIIKNIKEGILVDQLLGAGQSNTLSGEFNVGIDLGFHIENGKILGRIKNCMVAGNIFEVLKNISEISSDQEWVGGSSLLPAFLIENMTVAGK